jgi:hypothetical protein
VIDAPPLHPPRPRRRDYRATYALALALSRVRVGGGGPPRPPGARGPPPPPVVQVRDRTPSSPLPHIGPVQAAGAGAMMPRIRSGDLALAAQARKKPRRAGGRASCSGPRHRAQLQYDLPLPSPSVIVPGFPPASASDPHAEAGKLYNLHTPLHASGGLAPAAQARKKPIEPKAARCVAALDAVLDHDTPFCFLRQVCSFLASFARVISEFVPSFLR